MKKLTAEDFDPKNWHNLLWRFFTSWGLATVVLILMTIVTLVGTVDQKPIGLYAAKKKYFHSLFCTYEIRWSKFEKWDKDRDGRVNRDDLAPKHRKTFDRFDENEDGVLTGAEGTKMDAKRRIPIFLPGGLLLMTILVINLTLGAIVKVRKRAKGVGMLVAHLGMIFLLVSGFVTWAFTNEGYMALFEGDTSNRVESYRDWQLEVLPLDESGKAQTALTIPASALRPVGDGNVRVFQSEKLPFDIVVSRFAVNSAVVREQVDAGDQAEWEGKPIGGFRLVALRKRWKDEKRINIPGVYAEFRSKQGGGDPVEAIIAGESAGFRVGEKPMPLVFEQGDRMFAVQLVKKSWLVPYSVHLDDFIFEKHPGTQSPKNFESRITRIEDGGVEKKVAIRMNEPMRHEGLVFFQESYGSDPSRPDKGMYSQFAVNDNPADQWPLYALIVTGVGLLIHFLVKLGDYLGRALSKRQTPPTPSQS